MIKKNPFILTNKLIVHKVMVTINKRLMLTSLLSKKIPIKHLPSFISRIYQSPYDSRGVFIRNCAKLNIISKKPLLLLQPSVGYKPLCLPLNMRKINVEYISGLKTLEGKEREFYLESIEGPRTLEVLRAKILYYMFKKNYKSKSEQLMEVLDNIFSFMPELTLSKIGSKSMGNHRQITALQHCLVYICEPMIFTYQDLYDFCMPNLNPISYKEESKINILTFIEAYVFKKTLATALVTDRIYFTNYLVNPNNPGSIPKYSVKISQKFTQQDYGDIFSVSNSYAFSADVKGYSTMGLGRRYISIYHGSFKTRHLELNTLSVEFQNFLKDKPLDSIYHTLYQKFLRIKQNNIDSIETKLIKIRKLLLDTYFDCSFKDLNFSISIEAKIDNNFDEFYSKVLKGRVESADINVLREAAEKTFPPSPLVDFNTHPFVIYGTLDRCFKNDDFYELLRENIKKSLYHNIIEL